MVPLRTQRYQLKRLLRAEVAKEFSDAHKAQMLGRVAGLFKRSSGATS
jgi:hypothetical protein